MKEACSRCGRSRPSYISDPTCPQGGYCSYVEVTTASDIVDDLMLLQEQVQILRDKLQTETMRLDALANVYGPSAAILQGAKEGLRPLQRELALARMAFRAAEKMMGDYFP